MKHLLVIFILFSFVFGQEEAVIDPRLSAALKLVETFRSETKTTIGERFDQLGFKNLYNNYDYSSGNILLTNLDKLIGLWLNNIEHLSENGKKIIKESLEEYSLQIMDQPYNKQKFELSFNNGKGHLIMILLTISPHPTVPNAVYWEKIFLHSLFDPAPSYVIVTHSDCDFLSCDSFDEIVYLPTIITDSHIRSIININADILFGLSRSNNLINKD